MKHTGLWTDEEMATFGNLKEHAALIKENSKNGIAIERNACNISR